MTSIFSPFIKFELCEDLVSVINCIITPYKSSSADANIYSIESKKTVRSERRVSKKSSFDDERLSDIVNRNISPLLYGILKKTNPNVSYNIALGTSRFDYIKYENGGYFDAHKDFVRIDNESQQQYTMLIGLSKDASNYSGSTVLWTKVDKTTQSEYDVLLNGPEGDPFFIETTLKYNLPKNLSSIKEIFASNKSTLKYIPNRINCMNRGKALIFKSDIIHSGEEYHSWYNPKELFMCIINIVGVENNLAERTDSVDKINNWLKDTQSKIIMFDQFEMSMLEMVLKYKLIPFQIIISSGEYLGKKFLDSYLKFLNLQSESDLTNRLNPNLLHQINSTLDEIYAKTKSKLNTRGRESHISQEIITSTSDLSKIANLEKIYFDLDHIVLLSLDNIIQIKNYFLNYYINE